MVSNVNSIIEDGGSYTSDLARDAAESMRNLRTSVQNRTASLIEDFKNRLNLVSIIIFLVLIILLCVFIFSSYVSVDKNIYFTVLQYGSVLTLIIILFSFFFISRTGPKLKKY